MKQGGYIANKTGNNLEHFVENILKDEGYKFIEKNKFVSSILDIKIYTKQLYMCNGIYNSKIYCDFILFHPTKHPNCLVIESKWQQSSGSVDEKFPYLVLNIKELYPYKTIIVLDGGGYKKGAEIWLRQQVDNSLLGVYNMTEFRICVNKGKI